MRKNNKPKIRDKYAGLTLNQLEKTRILYTNYGFIDDDNDDVIRCNSVNLVYSTFRFPFMDRGIFLDLSLYVGVDGQNAFCNLSVEINYDEVYSEYGDEDVDDEEYDYPAIELEFELLGKFDVLKDISRKEIAKWLYQNCLQTMLPYAWEYANNLMKRRGFKHFAFPILDPHITLKKLTENDSVKVQYIDNKNKIVDLKLPLVR